MPVSELDPEIVAGITSLWRAFSENDMDGRHKPGHGAE
jgi:hypothetical protein